MRISRPRLPGWFLLHLLVYLTGVACDRAAQAQPAQPTVAKVSCEEDEECARLAASALEHSQAGRFEDAQQAYKSAYRRRPAAKLLYNLARVLHKAGRPAEAVTYYQRYLEADDAGSEEQRRKANDFLQQAIAQAALPSSTQSFPDPRAHPQPPPVSGALPQKPPAPALIPKRPLSQVILGGAVVGAGLLLAGFGTSALLAQGTCVAAPVAPAAACANVFTTNGVGGALVGSGAALALGGVIELALPPKRSLPEGT